MSEQDEQTEQLPEVVEIEGGGWKATCQTCGEWTVTKPEKISAIRALSAHMGSCPKSPRKTIGEPLSGPEKAEEAEVELPEYKWKSKRLAGILRDYGVNAKEIIPRIVKRVQEEPELLESQGAFIDELEAQGIKGDKRLHVITQTVFRDLNPDALRGFRSEDDREERGRRPVYSEGEGDREAMKEKDRAIADLTEKVHALELSILKTDMHGQLALRDDRISRLEAAVSQTPTGKTTLDVIDKGIDRLDNRASEIIDRLGKPGGSGEFKPEVKRTPRQRQEAAGDIQRQLEQKEKILEAENELLIAAARD